MNQEQLSKGAQKMFLQNHGRKAVIDFLTENGITDDQAETMATDAYKAIKPLREAAMKAKFEEPEPMGGGGMGSIAVGLLLLVGGIVATMNSTRIWYGLIVVGVIVLFKGLAKYIK